MKKTVTAILITLSLSACVIPHRTFVRAHTTPEQAAYAYDQCDYQASGATAAIPDPIQRGQQAFDLIGQCMNLQGYVQSAR